jgi:hypothetical protein
MVEMVVVLVVGADVVVDDAKAVGGTAVLVVVRRVGVVVVDVLEQANKNKKRKGADLTR